jgi:hypothetical protein
LGSAIQLIATHRAEYYAKEFGGDLYRSLAEDTLPLFVLMILKSKIGQQTT